MNPAIELKDFEKESAQFDALMHCSRGVEQAVSARSERRRRGERVISGSFGSHMVAGVNSVVAGVCPAWSINARAD